MLGYGQRTIAVQEGFEIYELEIGEAALLRVAEAIQPNLEIARHINTWAPVSPDDIHEVLHIGDHPTDPKMVIQVKLRRGHYAIGKFVIDHFACNSMTLTAEESSPYIHVKCDMCKEEIHVHKDSVPGMSFGVISPTALKP